MRTAVTLIVLLGLLAATAGVMLWAWQEIGEVAIGRHGLIALALGAGATFLLGAGLMALMFLSSRRGYDDRAHDSERSLGERSRPPADDD